MEGTLPGGTTSITRTSRIHGALLVGVGVRKTRLLKGLSLRAPTRGYRLLPNNHLCVVVVAPALVDSLSVAGEMGITCVARPPLDQLSQAEQWTRGAVQLHPVRSNSNSPSRSRYPRGGL